MELDIIIENEIFFTYEEWYNLACRIYIHTSLGGHVTITNCCLNTKIFEVDIIFTKWFNDMVGYQMIKEACSILPFKPIPYKEYWTKNMAKECAK